MDVYMSTGDDLTCTAVMCVLRCCKTRLWKYLEGVQSGGKRRVSTTGPLLTAIADFLEVSGTPCRDG
jgi:hypothetical protein